MSHAERPHSPYGMSVLHRYVMCPGSVRLIEALGPQPSSRWADEGRQAHELLEACLLHPAENRHIAGGGIDKEMLDAVSVCVDYVSEILDQYPVAVLLVEERLDIPSRAAPGQVWGTVDVAIYIPSLRLLYVVDYKHGAGTPVPLAGNLQTRGYALGVLSAHPEWAIDVVALVIVQPRVASFRLPIPEEWVPAFYIYITMVRFIDDAIMRTQAPDAPLVPGETQCRFCPAAVTCPARAQQALAVVDQHFAGFREVTAESLPAVDAMEPVRLAEILHAADLVENWFARIRERALEMVRSGVPVPGFKVVEAQARRHVLEGAELARMLTLPEFGGRSELDAWEAVRFHGSDSMVAEALGVLSGMPQKSFMPPQLLGLGDIETVLKEAASKNAPKGAKREVLKSLMSKFALLTTKRSSGRLSLVTEDDPRPAIDATKAFADVNVLPHVTELTN